jgi:hypothetical protein
MTEELFIASVAGLAALCGAAVGRTFAIEAPNRLTAVLAAAYCGAGAGIVSSIPSSFLLVLVVRWATTHSSLTAFLEAGEAILPGLLWGIVGGAGGGLLVGLVVAPFKRTAAGGRRRTTQPPAHPSGGAVRPDRGTTSA